MENTKCKECGLHERMKERRICKKCKSEKTRKHYSIKGRDMRLNKTAPCQICQHSFTQWRKKQVICPKCYHSTQNVPKVSNRYVKVGMRDEHRIIAEKILNRVLSYNEVVHHVDENPQNNSLDNLWVMSRHHHGKLHKFLRLQKVIYEKSLDCNSVNCWDNLRVVQTTTWLEMASVNVLKLNELVNQQPSPLKGEGSETRHGTP
jgi:hypothetical protein